MPAAPAVESSMAETQAAPTVSRYTGVAIVLHWLVALLIVGNLVMIWFVDRYPDAWVRPVIDLHKSIGLTVLGLVLLRILWRVGHRPPPMPADYPRAERLAAHAAHALLYAVILLLPLTGYIHDSAWKDAATHPLKLYGLVDWPRIAVIMHQPASVKESIHSIFFACHKYLAYVLYVLFVLHVGGALKHQIFDREAELQRMIPAPRGAAKG
jgi:cytochrome b561